ncbi:MAG: putative zinc-binding metallopeptidase [Bacteriovoracaceae bacterium]|nr:putative zinc-binding metallopeptidase [Bacteriovoracaceae bacterium]
MKWLLFLLIYSSQLLAVEITRKDFCLEYAAGTGPQAVRTELLTRNIKIEDEINPHLLGVLAGIFREYQFYGPLKIKLADSEGPKKAWVTGVGKDKTLWLAKNASDLVLGVEIEKVVNKVCNDKSDKVHELSISWTNTVYEQILRNLIEPKSITRRFIQVSGWQMESPASDPDHLLEQPFRDEEVVTIVKQFIDLPYEVLRAFGIQYMARAKVGRNVKGAAGIYYPEKKKILLTDGAFFSGGDIYGEGTVLHEFGHAWWFMQTGRLQETFSNISWKRDGKDWMKKGRGIEGFVSEYATKDPVEDFAESFSAFVHEPEKIIDVAKMKFLFLRQYVFKDITYFSTVAENAKVFVDSQTTDKKPPYLDDKIKKCLKFEKVSLLKEKITIKATLGCVWDIMSGPDEMVLGLEHKTEKDSRILISIKPIEGRKLGEPWVLEGEGSELAEKLITGEYLVKTLGLIDKAGNRDFLKEDNMPSIFIAGGMGSVQPPKEELNWSLVKFSPIDPSNGHLGYLLELPIKHLSTLRSILMSWYHQSTQEESTHYISSRYLKSNPGENLKMEVYFSKFHHPGSLVLSNMRIHYEGSSTTKPYTDEYPVPKGEKAPTHIVTSGEDLRGDLDVNAMKLSAFEGDNSDGGKWNIKMKIPLKRDSRMEFSIWVRVRTPSGSNLSFLISESSLERKGDKFFQENGKDWLEANLPLKIHPERGSYIFESLEITTSPIRDRANPDNLDSLKFIRRIKLLERGIKKEFKVRPDESLDLM